MPYFFLQENYDSRDQRNHVVPISIDNINDMRRLGIFRLSSELRIEATSQSSLTRLSLCLQQYGYQSDANFFGQVASDDPLLSISGFPRRLWVGHGQFPAAEDDDEGDLENEEARAGEGEEVEGLAELPTTADASLHSSSSHEGDTAPPRLQEKKSAFFKRAFTRTGRTSSGAPVPDRTRSSPNTSSASREGRGHGHRRATDPMGMSTSSSRSTLSSAEPRYSAETWNSSVREDPDELDSEAIRSPYEMA